MIPEPHVCVKCKREVVWTDVLPAICYLCSDKERQAKERETVNPDVVVEGQTVDMEKLEALYAEMKQRLAEDGGHWPIYTGDGK